MSQEFVSEQKSKNITLVLTHQCNLDCVYCYEHHKNSRTMSAELAKKIVDTEGDKLISAIKSGVYLIKPNLRELEAIVGKSLDTRSELLAGCNKLLDLGAENVLLSLGREGAILTNGSKSYFCKSASVAVNSTVGAGDSVVAAIAYAQDEGLDIIDTIKLAVATGAANVSMSGTQPAPRDLVDSLLDQVGITEL
jgi:1-phosphofructokinase